MAYCAVAANQKRLAVAMIVCLLGVVILPTMVKAQSHVQARICGDAAHLQLKSPVSDSVVTKASVTVAGSVTQARQLELYVDGALDGVAPLNAQQTQFATTVRLTPGTHTIRVVAIDACQRENAQQSVVVTYEPRMTMSTGGSMPTNLRYGGGVVVEEVSSEVVAPVEETTDSLPETVFETVAQPIVDFGAFLNLYNPTTRPFSPAELTPVTRFSLMAVGIGTTVFAVPLAAFLVPVISKATLAVSGGMVVLSQRRLRISLTLLGVGLMVLAFVL